MSDLEWIGMLESKVEEGKITRMELKEIQNKKWGEVMRNPPKTVTVGKIFKQCLKSLHQLFELPHPPVVYVQSKKQKVVLYVFVDASDGGYGSTLG